MRRFDSGPRLFSFFPKNLTDDPEVLFSFQGVFLCRRESRDRESKVAVAIITQ